MNRNKQKMDDLTQIKYIGPEMQSWLKDEMKVRTYKQLAALSVEEIQAKLKDDGKPVAKYKIEEWIIQAKERAPEDEDGDWKEYASFMVYFEKRERKGKQEKRIKVSHIEEDESVVWPELTAPDFGWMLKQAGESPFGEKPEPPKEEEPKPRQKIPAGEAEVKVSQVRLYQPPGAKKPLSANNGKLKKQELKAGEPFALEVLFSIAGEAAESVVKQGATYSVQIVAKETETKVGTDLGGSQPETLVKGTFEYSVRTPEMTLDPGLHQLWAMVKVRAKNTTPNFLEGPLVKVA